MGITNVDILQCSKVICDELDVPVVEAVATSNHIADANVAHTIDETFSNTEVKAALDALGGKINAILKALEDNKIVKTS